MRAKRILLLLAALSCVGISPPGMATPLINCGMTSDGEFQKCEGNNIVDNRTGLMWAGWSYFSGKVDRAGALAYIADLNRQKYGGYDDWRLPSAGLVGPGIGPDGCSIYDGSCNGGYNITRPEAELSYLWHKAGGRSRYYIDGSSPSPYMNYLSGQLFGLISYKEDNYYWLAERFPDTDHYWQFRYGLQKPNANIAYAWAVRTAFVPAVRPPLVAPELVPVPVPEPASFSLLAAALAVIVTLRRTARRKPLAGRFVSA